MTALVDSLRALGACKEAITWVRDYESLEAAWAACHRGDWMLRYAGWKAGRHGSDGHKKLTLCACECARLALPYTQNPCVLACIETAERWARGAATIEELRKAQVAVYAVADSYNICAADAAEASEAYAAWSAWSTFAYADHAAAAAAAAYAAYAAYAAARGTTHAQCADIVRVYYPTPPELYA